MVERIKSLRTLYHAVVFAACAVLLFAMMPDLSIQYRAALKELGELRRVSLSDYPAYIKRRLDKQNKANYELLLRAVRRDNIPIRGRPRFTYVILCGTPPRQAGLRLVDYDRFVERNHRAAAIVVDPNAASIAQKLRAATASFSPPPALVGIELFSPVNDMTAWPDNTRVLDWQMLGNSATDLTEVQFYFSNLSGHPPTVPPILVTFHEGPVQSGPLAIDWLRSDRNGRQLFGSVSGTFLPRLRMFWGRVGTMSIDGATSFLEEQIESTSKGSLSFFGVPVERGLVIWVGPALCLSLLLFFVLHLKHFILTAGDDPSGICKAAGFPWVVLFPGRTCGFLGYITLFLLPVAANALLLLRHGELRERSTCVGIALLLGMTALCIWGAGQVRRFRLALRNG